MKLVIKQYHPINHPKIYIMNKFLFSLLVILLGTTSLFAQDTSSELFEELRLKDSLIFKLGYNQCDTTQMRALFHDDFEFYHDQGGLMDSKEAFIKNMPNLCKMSYKATRELVAGSLEVYPLYNNGQLYGAIQKGVHEFYAEEEGKPIYLTSTAKFTHLWVLNNDQWQLKRVLSYDHVVPGE
jgi:hypothetical protein